MGDLWFRLLHYEGTPGLWQTLLHILTRLGLPYAALNVTAGLLGLAAVWLIVRHSPLPLILKLALPFTFYLGYQYSVVARSYSLVPVLLFGCAILYSGGVRRIAALTALLCLLALVSVHGLVLSACIWLSFHFSIPWRKTESSERKRLLIAAAAYCLAILLAVWSAWPAPDVTFIAHRNFSFEHLVTVTGAAFTEAFTGSLYISLLAIALSLPFLWRGRGLLFFALAAISLCAVFAVIYAQVWHFGILFLAWLFALWIAANNTRPGIPAIVGLTLAIAFQIPWTVASIAWDWENPYSGARDAAMFLRASGIPNHRLYAIGYACAGIQPYFPANIFANWNGGARPAFWDWSRRNHSLADLDRLAELKPDYVIVGHTGMAEKILWNHAVKKSGYVAMRHFEGNLFWHDDVFEPDAFDLYRRRDLK
ncbi:MAG: hypothetical protein JWO80_895 [Bryobacterales bacterium]|nr:hypothetical protein [Bryobacterales bacterium]